VGAEWESHTPWNVSAFNPLPLMFRPLSFKWIVSTVSYSFLSTLFQTGITAQYGVGDVQRTRLKAFVRKELPFGEDLHTQFALSTHLAADMGDEIPQDFL